MCFFLFKLEKEFKNKNAGIINVLEKKSREPLKISLNENSFIFIFSALNSNPEAKIKINTATKIIKTVITQERPMVSIPLNEAYKETAQTAKAINDIFIFGEITFDIKTKNKDKL